MMTSKSSLKQDIKEILVMLALVIVVAPLLVFLWPLLLLLLFFGDKTLGEDVEIIEYDH